MLCKGFPFFCFQYFRIFRVTKIFSVPLFSVPIAWFTEGSQYRLTPKMATIMFAETLEKFQHSTRLSPIIEVTHVSHCVNMSS